ncbi:dimethyladenosine transferase [Alicycliphilus sp. B1]|nr:dimethyladenosine transferase [Alicycliphilus sp. B1]
MIELDRDLAARLRQHGQLDVIESDVLKVDFTQVAQTLAAPKIRVVGNLPYNISTPILFHLMAHVQIIEDQHFMLQKEVIDRMVAAPATAAYGRLSVMLQWRYAMEDVLFVPPEASTRRRAWTAPWCACCPHARPAAVDEALLSELVQVAFSQRRKLLRHTLGRWLEGHGYAEASTPSAAPRRCPWRITWPWRRNWRRRNARRRAAPQGCVYFMPRRASSPR